MMHVLLSILSLTYPPYDQNLAAHNQYSADFVRGDASFEIWEKAGDEIVRTGRFFLSRPSRAYTSLVVREASVVREVKSSNCPELVSFIDYVASKNSAFWFVGDIKGSVVVPPMPLSDSNTYIFRGPASIESGVNELTVAASENSEFGRRVQRLFSEVRNCPVNPS